MAKSLSAKKRCILRNIEVKDENLCDRFERLNNKGKVRCKSCKYESKRPDEPKRDGQPGEETK